MTDKRQRSTYASGAALVMAVTAFIFGSAPFTPALILAVLAIPIAFTCIFLGAQRTSAAALYWAVAALLVVPVSDAFDFRVDLVLLLLGVAGLVLSAILYANYARAGSSASGA